MSDRFFEALEIRRLMTASLVNGVLTVTGTGLENVIAISQDKTRVRVNEDGSVSAFTASRVKRIVVHGLGGNDQILGRPNLTKPMSVFGGPGRDTLVGGSANDKLFGDDGEDRLDGGKGSDLLSGGTGFDHADFSARTANLSIALDDVANDGEQNERDNVGSDIEGITTGKGDDRIIGSSADNVIRSGDGADTVYGMSGNDTISTGETALDTGLDRVHGGDGNDWIRAGSFSVIARGDAGSDTIYGSERADTLYGGAGNDQLRGLGGSDQLDGGDDDDGIMGANGNDTIRGGAGNDGIYGDAGDDLIWGESENGLFSSGAITPIETTPIGNVVSQNVSTFAGGMISPGLITAPIVGGGGGNGPIVFKPIDPVIVTKVNFDTILGGEGNDTIRAGDGDDVMNGEAGNDRLAGDDGADLIFGVAGDDELFGGAGVDSMYGGEGQDTLVSIGGGIDQLSGEGGSDRFWKGPDDTTDADFSEILFGGLQEVSSFANGVSIELKGQDLPDPSGYYLDNGRTSTGDLKPGWRNFASNPLFSPSGIQSGDVRQGDVADEVLLTALRAIAGKQPLRIKQAMVDLGDGTYAVKLISPDGAHRYYRVDADLPVKRDGTPVFVGLGNAGSIWGAMMEKAFTLHRGGPGIGTYHSLRTFTLDDAFGAFGMRQRWVGSEISDIKVALGTGKLVTMRSTSGGSTAGLTSNTLYIVERVNMETRWEPGRYVEYTYKPAEWIPGKWVDVPVSITLRDPAEREVTVRTDQIKNNFDTPQSWL